MLVSKRQNPSANTLGSNLKTLPRQRLVKYGIINIRLAIVIINSSLRIMLQIRSFASAGATEATDEALL